ncbi:related to N-acetyltransferase [Melanopsichium pennsylvanicum]|uniref:Related to N-acetyltransferase n=2 Tax=Melanopsichium pennsylvanicum TaxID=63383 RepID=A0AAJ4XHT3_9BASI|nr:related to N-acetyltransferase [Melanopsichium pennsylvanicum 4]SNX81443.1 related to N-acetyltransferase [Melanopsichium pennsylvanicum]
MRINQNTVLLGNKVVLVPYRQQHVPRYHEWMKDPLIQEQTASEPLTLDEEYEMQRSWAIDEDKLTFIIHALPQIADDNLASTSSAQNLVSKCTMVGDVNIFFNEVHKEETDEDDTEQAVGTNPVLKNVQQQLVFDAECEIMIAEHGHRRKGMAREALQMMFAFVTASQTPIPVDATQRPTIHPTQSETGPHCSLPIPPSWLTCKISLKNGPSIKLFESLGFTKHKITEVWQEVEMRLTNHEPAYLGQLGQSIRQVLFFPDE